MADANLILVTATYDDATSAQADYKALKSAESEGLVLVSAVVLHRDAEGAVKVDESGEAVAGGAVLGAAAGLVVGLFAPPLLLVTAIGAGLGALGGELVRKHEEKKLGLEMDDVLPPNSSAIVALVDDAYADRVDKALEKAVKRVNKAVDSGDAEKLEKALAKSDKQITDALEG